jgi:uncharacterized protein YggE
MKTLANQTLITLLAMAVITIPATAQRTDVPPPPMIVVNGNSNVRVAPDEATVRIGIVRQANNAQVAQQQTNAVAEQITAALTKLGIRAADIQSSRLTLTPMYDTAVPRRGNEAPRIVAYNAQNVVSVTVSNLNLVGPVIDAGFNAGANQLEGVQFSLRDELPSRQEALKQAAVDARKKAEAIAEALGLTLGNVQEVAEGGVSVMSKGDAAYNVRSFEAAPVPAPVSPGELEVNASVTIRFLIGNRR